MARRASRTGGRLWPLLIPWVVATASVSALAQAPADGEETVDDEASSDEDGWDEAGSDEGGWDEAGSDEEGWDEEAAEDDEDWEGDGDEDGDGEAAEASDAEDAEGGDDEDEEPSSADDETGAPAEPNTVPEDETVWLDGEAALPDADGDRWQLIVPPLLLRNEGGIETRAFFPLFYLRESPEDTELVVLNYYFRRGTLDADVLFPIFWSLRGPDRFTFSLVPFYYHREGRQRAHGLFPLYFVGRFETEQYTFVPPALFFTHRNHDFAFTLATLYWRVRKQKKKSWGLFPLVWTSHDENGSSDVVLPLYFRFRDELDDRTTIVVPPIYHRREPNRVDWGVAPLVLHGEQQNGQYWTIPPLLFHHERFDDRMKLVTPLFLYFEDEAPSSGSTFISWLYQNHRGDTRLDAVAPLFFWHRDTRDGSSTLMATPLFWHLEDPSSYKTTLFPLFARWGTAGDYHLWVTPLAAREESERSRSAVTWVFPTFQTRREPDTFIFNIHPIWYFKDAPERGHSVLPPLWWDFDRRAQQKRETVLFPVYWRFASGDEVTQVAGNTYFRRYRERSQLGWEFHFFPLFAFGKPRPEDHWWSVLYGLAGYRRQGPYGRTQLLWIPFQTDGPD